MIVEKINNKTHTVIKFILEIYIKYVHKLKDV